MSSEPRFDTEPQFVLGFVSDPATLDVLQEKRAAHGDLMFNFSPEYLEKLKRLVNERGIHVIARNAADQSFAGYIAATTNSLPAYPDTVLIVELFVDPKEQGRGLGRKLMQAVIDSAKTRGLRGAVVQTENENTPAQTLYEKLGFKKVENPDWKDGVTYQMEW